MQRASRVVLFGAALALAASAVYGGWHMHSRTVSAAEPARSAAPRAASSAAPGPTTLIDPLSPDRPATLDDEPRADAGSWVKARPGFQYSRSTAERGGAEPCALPEGDTSSFSDWAPIGLGKLSAPRALDLGESGDFELVIHLNGDIPVRRELIQSGQPFVLYALTLDPSQSYAPVFTGPHVYEAMVSAIEQTMTQRVGKPAHARRVALSAWSAGFVGIEAALAQPQSKDVDAVILIDGLHAPRGDEAAFKAQLDPFLSYARRAAAGERLMVVSHSSIDPPNFASTTECAHYLIAALGGTPLAVRRADPLGLELVEYYSRGGFQVRGYAGNDKADHCAQLAVLRTAFTALGRRWAVRGAPSARHP